ncbi:alpha/beta hydrolase-fold protein [Rhodoglobus sp. NPDC076762]
MVAATPAVAADIYSAALGTPSSVELDLAGDWQFSVGDDPSWASPAFDDSDWTTLQVPEVDGAPQFADYDGFGWYRLTFMLPAEAQGSNLVASLGFIDDVDEAFLNGEKIGGSGTMPPNASSQWFEQRLYPIPATAPRFGELNTLAVRVYDMSGGGGWYQGPVGIYSKDQVRENVHGISGPQASPTTVNSVLATLALQRDALAAGDADAYLATLTASYEHNGRDLDRREREIRNWLAASGTLTLTDSEVEVIEASDGRLIVDTNRTITGTKDGAAFEFEPTTQEFLAFERESYLEAGNESRFFRDFVDSALEDARREYVAYLPPSYFTEPTREFPVVYLLHGVNGGSREWEPRDFGAKLDELYTTGGLAESIVIMPDGESLWYTDHLNGTPWRSMFIDELIPQVDAEYRTLATREFRGLSGISMGGFGAYSIGLAYPDLFSSLASHIGAIGLSPAQVGVTAPGGVSAQPRSPINDVKAMPADVLSSYDFYFDVCEYDDYGFATAARAMNTALTEKSIEHTWAVYPEGRHNDACWMPHIADSFGMHSAHQRAAGLQEDWVAPTLDVSTGAEEPNAAGWFRGAVTITATSTDAGDSAPTVEFRRDGAEWAKYSGPIEIAGDARHSLEMRATDAAGNVSAVSTQTVWIDSAAPTVAATFDSTKRSLTLTGADAVSGVQRVEYSIGGDVATARAAFLEYTGPVSLGSAATVVSFRAIDAAGNAGALERITIAAAGAVQPGAGDGATSSGSDASGLAFTGTSLGGYLALAALLLALGIAFVSRRRRILPDAPRRAIES